MSATALANAAHGLEPGDRLELELEHYRYDEMEVLAVEHDVEWEVPMGTDWPTRRLRVESTDPRSSTFYAIDVVGDDLSFSTDSYGAIERLEPIGEQDTGGDADATDAAEGDVEDDDLELPDGVARDDVHAAVDAHESMGAIADELGTTTSKARAVVWDLDRYGDVRETNLMGRSA